MCLEIASAVVLGDWDLVVGDGVVLNIQLILLVDAFVWSLLILHLGMQFWADSLMRIRKKHLIDIY